MANGINQSTNNDGIKGEDNKHFNWGDFVETDISNIVVDINRNAYKEDDNKTTNSFLFENSRLYDNELTTSYSSDVFQDTTSFNKLIDTISSQQISQASKVSNYVTTIQPKRIKVDDAAYSYIIYVDDNYRLYSEENLFVFDDKLAVVSTYLSNGWKALDNSTYSLVKLDKTIETNNIFVYLTYNLGTPYMTYVEYLGEVQNLGGVYLGSNIPKYNNLDLVNSAIDINSINCLENVAVKTSNSEGNWWTILTRQDVEEFTTKDVKKISCIEDAINCYTWGLRYDDIVKYNSKTKEYTVFEFTCFTPQNVRYKFTYGDNDEYTGITNTPITVSSSTSPYYISLYQNITSIYENANQRDFRSLRIEFTRDKLEDSDVKSETVSSITIGKFDDETSLYYYDSPDNVSFTPIYTFSEYSKVLFGEDLVNIGDLNYDVAISTSYLYTDDNNDLCTVYTTNILDIDNYLARYLHIRLIEKQSRSIIDASLSIPTIVDNSSAPTTPLFSYQFSKINELEYGERITYVEYITRYNEARANNNIDTFKTIISYNTQYSWNIGKDTNITYIVDRVFPKNVISPTYTFYNPYSTKIERYNGTVLTFYGVNYGVYPSISDASYISIVYKKQAFKTNENDKFIDTNKVVNINTYTTIPLALSNEYEINYTGEYEYVHPAYTYLIRYKTPEKEGDKGMYSVSESLLNEGYWNRKYTKNIKPLVNISYTYISKPYELSKNNVSPYIKNEVLGWKYQNRITYNEKKTVNVENFYYTYWGEIKASDGKTSYYCECILDTSKYELFNSGDNITFFAFIKGQDGVGNPIFTDYLTVTRRMKVKTEDVVEESVYQEEGLVPLCAYTESSFGITNRKQVVIKDTIYVPETYIDILTVDPNTNEEFIKKVKSSDAYFAYSYVLEEVPFKTASYVYSQNAIQINKIDELINAISNIRGNTIYYSDGEAGGTNVSLADAMRDAFTYMKSDDYSYLSNTINDGFIKLSNYANNISRNIADSTYLSHVSTYINSLSSQIEELKNSIVSSSATNTSNAINASKKMFDRFEEIMNRQIDVISDVSLNINNSITSSGTSAYLDAFGSGSKLKNSTTVYKIGYENSYDKEIETKRAIINKNNRNLNQEIETSISTYTEYIPIDPEVVSNYSSLSFGDGVYGALDRIGIHKAHKLEKYQQGSYFYEKSSYVYQNIADILADLKVGQSIPTKKEFIIDVSKKLFISSDFILSYTSPNEYAKKAIYRANALWNELVEGKYVEDDNPERLQYPIRNQHSISDSEAVRSDRVDGENNKFEKVEGTIDWII